MLWRSKLLSGKGGIRTLGGPEPTTVFETVPFNHSGTFPCWDKIILCPTCGGIITEIYSLRLWRESIASAQRESYFHARMQFRIINLMHILSFQFFCQCGGRQCFTMHKENFLHGIFDVHCILRQ